MTKNKSADSYNGFEQGPIRPPSEANSLLIRATRNCPWNRCTFCRAYKGTKFSIRPVEHVIKDVDSVSRHIETLQEIAEKSGRITQNDIHNAIQNIEPDQMQPFYAAVNWLAGGMESVFIQDGNSLIRKPQEIVAILKHIKARFPWVERITSYARSHTIARIKNDDLKAIGDAGLNRIHIGLESGSDQVLKMVKKGVTKDTHIKAGLNVKKAGIELSEYVMPGLGGRKYSKIHAEETADALNRINPDFIRIRTLAIPNEIELFDDYMSGRFKKCTDIMMAEELLLFIENLDNITSVIKSDHILNLFEELEGTLPEDKNRMVNILRTFLSMDKQRQCVYQVGRRLGFFRGLNDMNDPYKIGRVEAACREFEVTPDNVDQMIDNLMKRFV